MIYPPQPPSPPGLPVNYLGGIPCYPGTNMPIVDPRTVMAQSAAAQAAAAAAAMEQQRRFRRSLERHRFTRWHEWVTIDDGIATVGITGYAIQRLGQIVHVSLPAAGTLVNAGARCGQVESRRAVTNVHSPVAGRITEVNERAGAKPDLVRTDPYGGWLFRLAADRPAMPADLLSLAEYEQLTGSAV